jgi:hypothetical protein
MDTGSLLVGSLPVCGPDEVYDELLTVFRDDMAHIEQVPAERYEEYTSAEGPYTDAFMFRASARVIADRLNLMGIDAPHVLAGLDETLRHEAGPVDDELLAQCDEETRALLREEQEILDSMSAQDWINRLAATPDDPEAADDKSLGARGWLLHYLDRDNGWDVRRRLRLILLAFPDAEVSLDATWVNGWRAPSPGVLLSEARRRARDVAASHTPLIVLTEGTTDTEFLSTALTLLHPHVTDLVRFLDYERRPEGGAGAVLRAVRAFDAAGIANRVVALLDNDAAAADALRGYRRIGLPDRIRVTQYPPLDLARQYPTLGPPTARSTAGSIELADVNGLAASIELYLGRDVLTRNDGSLHPVQWRSFINGIGRYHGEVIGKHEIHTAFRAKAAAALQDPATVSKQDWDGLRLILDAILTAFH